MKLLTVGFSLIFTLIFWASAFVGIRVGLDSYSPGALALLRFLVASACMAIIYLCLPEKKKMRWADRVELLAIGAIGIGAYNICLNIGETEVTAGVASFVIGLMPVMTTLLAVLFLKERPGALTWWGILVSTIGLGLMILAEKHSSAGNGVFIILISSLSGAFYSITQKRYLRSYHPVAITSWVIWGGTLVLFWFAPELWRQFPYASHKATLTVVYLGIFPAALAYAAWCYVLDNMSASNASMYLYALPILSTIMGVAFLNEYPSVLSLSGGLLALAGALIATRFQQKTVKGNGRQFSLSSR
ncbi:DMT family transporter [Legionella dresdenensis]|uniref:DMT family transporter n=1 Tax=Legionella dresdenensis TaxID=450200 RepID=A0ABV8CH26_9GAMM